MLIRTRRPCEIAGRTVAAGLPLDLPEEQAMPLIEAGAAERWEPPPRREPPPEPQAASAEPPKPSKPLAPAKALAVAAEDRE